MASLTRAAASLGAQCSCTKAELSRVSGLELIAEDHGKVSGDLLNHMQAAASTMLARSWLAKPITSASNSV